MSMIVLAIVLAITVEGVVEPGYYRSKYTDKYRTAQQIEIGQISAGDAQAVRKLCEDIGVAYAG